MYKNLPPSPNKPDIENLSPVFVNNQALNLLNTDDKFSRESQNPPQDQNILTITVLICLEAHGTSILLKINLTTIEANTRCKKGSESRHQIQTP